MAMTIAVQAEIIKFDVSIIHPRCTCIKPPVRSAPVRAVELGHARRLSNFDFIFRATSSVAAAVACGAYS
jgi:hypothetical protein